MSTVLPTVALFLLLLIAIFHPFGLHFTDWNQPITATDLGFYVLLLYFALVLEIRAVAKRLKGKV